jgi:hypothetical protein
MLDEKGQIKKYSIATCDLQDTSQVQAGVLVDVRHAGFLLSLRFSVVKSCNLKLLFKLIVRKYYPNDQTSTPWQVESCATLLELLQKSNVDLTSRNFRISHCHLVSSSHPLFITSSAFQLAYSPSNVRVDHSCGPERSLLPCLCSSFKKPLRSTRLRKSITTVRS